MTTSVETLVESYNVLVSSPLQYVILLLYFSEAAFISHVSLIDRLKRHKFARESMNGQVDLAKRSFTNDLSNLIVVYLRVIDFVGDVRKNRIQNQFTWSQLATLYEFMGNNLFIFRA